MIGLKRHGSKCRIPKFEKTHRRDSKCAVRILPRPGLPGHDPQNPPVSTSFLYFPVSSTDMSTENCTIFNITTVQKEIFVGIGSVQKDTFRQFFFFEK
jgi:hypothetical protein